MKLNYRDRMILLGVIAVAIVLIGVFLLIKPKIEEIKEDNTTLTTVQTDWEEKEKLIAEIKPLKEEINDSYNASAEICKKFIDVELIDYQYELDEYMQKTVDECNLEVVRLDLSAPVTAPITYYYFEPTSLSSSMLDAADIDGSYSAKINAVMAESNSLSQRTQETVMQTKYGILAKGEKQNIWDFMTAIDEMNTSVVIDSVSIADYTFGEGDPESDGRSEVTMVVSFYSVFPMANPNVE